MLMHQLLFDNAARRPEAPALGWVDRGKVLSYGGAAVATERMAGALASLGVRPGDRVTVFANNGLDYLLVMLGTWRLGAILATVNLKLADDLAYYLGDHEPSVLVYTHEMHERVRSVVAEVAPRTRLVCMDGPEEGALALGELLDADLPPPPDPADEDAIAHLSYTSGTTGRPKGACLAHEPTVRASRCIAERLRLRASDVSLGPTALSSSYQLVGNLLPALAVGAACHVLARWSAEAGFAAIERIGATALVANPPILADLLAACDREGRLPGHLRYALTGGAPMPPALERAYRDRWALPIVESYGQSELGGFVALGHPELVMDDAALARVGPPPPDKEVRIVDTEDRPLPPGEVGEIVLRGGFMRGYWQRPEATAAATRGGWLRTGDVGVIDRDGHLTVRGRRSELLEVAGRSWFPRDVEELVLALPGVREAALVGRPDPELGTRPVLFLAAEPGRVPEPSALRAHITSGLGLSGELAEVHLLDRLPQTPTGKIAKAELAARARNSG
jgi:acyl-CoA synthetase (AMP-forming)/AMP-acid ligase II